MRSPTKCCLGRCCPASGSTRRSGATSAPALERPTRIGPGSTPMRARNSTPRCAPSSPPRTKPPPTSRHPCARGCMLPSRARPSSSGYSGIRPSGWRLGRFSGASLAQRRRLTASPNLLRPLHDPSKLCPFDLFGHRDMLGGAGREPALRAQTQLLELDIAARFLDPPFEDIDALQVGNLGGDEAEYHQFSLRHASQRCERPGARIVVFEKIVVDLHRVEQRLCDGIVADVRLPARILAAANVNPDGHSLRRARDDGIDDIDVNAQEIAPVIAALRQQLTHAWIAELHQRRFVDLQIAASGVRERAHFLDVSFDQVGPEGVEVGIDIAADIGAPRAIMNVAGARERDLGRARGQRLEKAKVVGVLWSLPDDAADNRWNAP